MKFLVTGAGGPAGINVINYFPKKHSVIACDADPDAKKRLGLVRRGIKFYRVPLARDDAFQAELTKIVDEEKPEYIIPTVDEELGFFSQSNAAYMDRIVISKPETIKTCLDKKLLYDFFKGKPYCPRFMVAYDAKQLKGLFGEEPVFMKPRIGRGSRGVKYFDNVESIPRESINTDNVFCEFLPGQEYTADTLCDMKGKLLVTVPRKRLDTNQGISTLGETERREDIIKSINDICESLRIRGPSNIQFKLDREGKPKLVEINPRFSGGLPITASSGINTVEILAEMLSGKKIDKKRLRWLEIRAENLIAKKIGRSYRQP